MQTKKQQQQTAIEKQIAELTFTAEVGLSRIAAETAATRDGIRLRGASARQVLGTASTVVSTVACQWLGFMLADTAGNGATLRFRDGGPEGQILGTVTLAAGESVRDFFGPQGIGCTLGVYLEIVSGQIDGAVFIGTAT